MCIIVSPAAVSDTKILVCPLKDNRQLTVYENKVSCAGSNAMILPVPYNGQSDIELLATSDKYPNLWNDLNDLFPKIPPGGLSFGSPASAWTLPVQQVGGYKCSVAYSVEDVARVNASVFQLPGNISTILRTHYSSGFAFLVCVFENTVQAHPIAYVHTRAPNGAMFIPSRHAHDNKPEEDLDHFDHAVYVVNGVIGAFSNRYTSMERVGLPAARMPKLSLLVKRADLGLRPGYQFITYMQVKGEFPNTDYEVMTVTV